MSEAIERAAAVALRTFTSDAAVFHTQPPEVQDLWIAIVRASFATINNPTPEMIAVGAKKIRIGSANNRAAATWRAMHDTMMGKAPLPTPQVPNGKKGTSAS